MKAFQYPFISQKKSATGCSISVYDTLGHKNGTCAFLRCGNLIICFYFSKKEIGSYEKLHFQKNSEIFWNFFSKTFLCKSRFLTFEKKIFFEKAKL